MHAETTDTAAGRGAHAFHYAKLMGARLTRAPAVPIALALIAVGWFGMNSIVVSLGRLSQGTRFYQLLAVIHHPAQLVAGVGESWETPIFAALCLAVLAAGLFPYFSARRSARLASLLPLALMCTCAYLLYSSGSMSQPPSEDVPNTLRGDLLRMAQHALARAQDRMAGHVGVGAGAYLSLLSSTFLAWRGMRASGSDG
ncbi:MAG: hypothetical protein ACHQAR_01740 [Steroidobacterales bacterium]